MIREYPELAQARKDMLGQSALYRPTMFWDAASTKIVTEICEHGVENFRQLSKSLSFFVPTYGPPANSLSRAQVEALEDGFGAENPKARKQQMTLRYLLGGEASALADYRVLLAGDTQEALPKLHIFSECSYGNPSERFEFAGRFFSRSALNYLLGLAFLKKHLNGDVLRTVIEVGGGFGTLGEVLAAGGIDGLRYVNLDIPPTSFIAQCYLTAALGAEHLSTYAGTRGRKEIQISSLRRASVLCCWQIENLQGEADLFVNFISFQEMEPPVVQNYLHHVDRLQTRYVLLRNLREGKAVKSEEVKYGVEVPTKGEDYDRYLENYNLIATNVHPFGHRTVDGFHSELRLYKRRG
jgi:putative sugar O-methyltransferase